MFSKFQHEWDISSFTGFSNSDGTPAMSGANVSACDTNASGSKAVVTIHPFITLINFKPG